MHSLFHNIIVEDTKNHRDEFFRSPFDFVELIDEADRALVDVSLKSSRI